MKKANVCGIGDIANGAEIYIDMNSYSSACEADNWPIHLLNANLQSALVTAFIASRFLGSNVRVVTGPSHYATNSSLLDIVTRASSGAIFDALEISQEDIHEQDAQQEVCLSDMKALFPFKPEAIRLPKAPFCRTHDESCVVFTFPRIPDSPKLWLRMLAVMVDSCLSVSGYMFGGPVDYVSISHATRKERLEYLSRFDHNKESETYAPGFDCDADSYEISSSSPMPHVRDALLYKESWLNIHHQTPINLFISDIFELIF